MCQAENARIAGYVSAFGLVQSEEKTSKMYKLFLHSSLLCKSAAEQAV